jgi:LPXTG-motif cell wall-anchored protein
VTAGDTTAGQIGSNVTFTNATYRTTINIIKVNADSVGQKLNGAQFQLAKWDGTKYQQVGDYATTEGSDENSGRCSFTGLLNGEYRIKEMVTPAGYIKTENNDIYFKVENGVITRYNKQVGESDRALIAENADEALIKYEKSDKAATFTVGNTPGVALPNTGGSGTALIYALGVGLLALAALGFILRARKENE